MTEIHPIPPLYSKNSEILILGSFPSVKSRENEFFYAHPQNRFWKVLSAVFNSPLPKNTDEKKELVLKNKLALFDVIKQCDIKGSGDSTIKNVIPNDLSPILDDSNIKRIILNGRSQMRSAVFWWSRGESNSRPKINSRRHLRAQMLLKNSLR